MSDRPKVVELLEASPAVLPIGEARRLFEFACQEFDKRDVDRAALGAARAMATAIKLFIGFATDKTTRAAWERYCAAHPTLRTRVAVLEAALEAFEAAQERR